MSRFTIRLDDELTENIEDATEAGQFDTKAEAVRYYLRRGITRDEVEDELASVKAERDELRSQLQAVTRRQRDVDELVEYVEEEQTLQERTRGASAFQRFAWWLVGDPEYRDDDE